MSAYISAEIKISLVKSFFNDKYNNFIGILLNFYYFVFCLAIFYYNP